MATELDNHVVFPWIHVSVPVDVTFSELTGEEHIALRSMRDWTAGLRTSIERACFADYLEHVEAIDGQPPTVPVIKRPSEVWEHIQVRSVRPQGADLVVVYAEPSWDDNLHHEWCIQGNDRLLYVGQFLGYSADSYGEIESGNSARNYDQTIARLGHLPQAWNSHT
jgi:hypothetical protein